MYVSLLRPIIPLVLLIALLSACGDDKQGNSLPQNNITYPDIISDTQDTSNTEDVEDTKEIEEDTYSIWTDPCVECAWYFCANLDVMYQKQICVNNCEDPATVVYESECKEHLECNPAQQLLETAIPCTTEDGYPGFKDKICNKGQIQYTNCKSDCSEEVCDLVDNDCDGEIDEGVINACGQCGDVPEEVCDYIDNDCDGVIDNGVANACGGCGKVPEEVCNGIDDDCDGEVDEGQLNACGECGPLEDEICDGIDNDCNGLIDEDLVGECSTDCEKNLQYCVGGQWICTAKQPKEEICNGLDDDCDGKADEGLDCLCTKQDIGTLFKCQESPLVCGAGYKTCECADPSDPTCSELQLTECLATCHWFPETVPAGSTCDKYLGEIKPEECNNHDDNCNQLVDEDLFANCYSGPPETMLVGICLPGVMTCLEGSWGNYDDNNDFIKKLCLGEVVPQPEDICNGTDTNCDGKIDEDKELEPTDILFIIDLSGSMQEEINAVTTALNKFATHYSDSDVIKWGLVFTASATPLGERVVLATDLVDFQTFMSIFENYGFSLMGGEEQNYDAIYMAIHNLIGPQDLPYALSDLEWKGPYSWSNSPIDSSPPKDTWKISWRNDAKHVIILFSDEEGQTYLEPKITENILVNMINAADELAIYAFTQDWLIDSGASDNYVVLTQAGMKGKAYYLTMKAIEMYNNLLEILDETACGGKTNP
mgnify:CR=1 FL=1|tara:strand:- start:4773 stop:6905 length:2133 start_codon:yes stop_codon:yes gene_type:complete